jgi:hypothetical protein
MGGLFSSPKAPAMPASPTPPPAPPTVDQAALSQTQDSLLRSRRGAAASVLAGQNPQAPTSLGSSRLLGG